VRRLIIALALFCACSAPVAAYASPDPGPETGLPEALQSALVQRWFSVQVWNDTVARNEWYTAVATARPQPQRGATTPRSLQRSTSPSGSSAWDRVAQCESGGNWSINTGNGYLGGLQMTMQFWAGHGGLAFAPRPDLATPDEQIAVAERAGSRAPWPVCGSG